MDAVYARTAADDAAGTACRDQVREALGLVEDAGKAAVYGDPERSGLDADRPGLRRLLADVRRGDLRRVVVRDLARLARSAALLETILCELRAAGVELLTVEGAGRHA
jgi:DNA invertase Pin-like site-specific DNA recombinase